jgi:hypothetical protein
MKTMEMGAESSAYVLPRYQIFIIIPTKKDPSTEIVLQTDILNIYIVTISYSYSILYILISIYIYNL